MCCIFKRATRFCLTRNSIDINICVIWYLLWYNHIYHVNEENYFIWSFTKLIKRHFTQSNVYELMFWCVCVLCFMVYALYCNIPQFDKSVIIYTFILRHDNHIQTHKLLILTKTVLVCNTVTTPVVASCVIRRMSNRR